MMTSTSSELATTTPATFFHDVVGQVNKVTRFGAIYRLSVYLSVRIYLHDWLVLLLPVAVAVGNERLRGGVLVVLSVSCNDC